MYKVNMTGFMKTVSKNSRPALAFFSSKSTIKKFKGISACFSSTRLSFGHVMIQLVGYNLTVLFVHSSIQLDELLVSLRRIFHMSSLGLALTCTTEIFRKRMKRLLV